MRHWSKAPVVVHAAPPKDTSNTVNAKKTAWPELPMPRDSHLYSPMSQALLRAARMGRVNKQPPPLMEEEKEPREEDDADGELDAGFSIRRWTLVPKHLEGPEPEFLAKRRKGLPSFYAGTMGPAGTPGNMRKTKIKKIDNEGNVSVWDVLVPEGQTVEGEILEEEPVMTEAPAPGTVVEGVGVVNSEGVVIASDQMLSTPPRRRPPPPKRKGKGIAKGKRKRVGFVSISKGGPPAKRTNGYLAAAPTGGAYTAKPINVSDAAAIGAAVGAASTETGGADTPMQDGEEGPEEGSEDDEDGEDGEENDREEGEVSPSPSFSKSPSKTPAANTTTSGPDLKHNHYIPSLALNPQPIITTTITLPPPNRDLSSSPDLPLAATQHAPLIRIEPAPDPPTPEPTPDNKNIPTRQSSFLAKPPTPAPDPAPAETHLPINPNLLNSPTIPPPPPPQQQQQQEADDDSTARFPDGEEDLLGSLERSLGRRGESEVAPVSH